MRHDSRQGGPRDRRGRRLGRADGECTRATEAHLHLADINPTAMNATADQIGAALGRDVAVSVCDLCDTQSIAAFTDQVKAAASIDILVNNAGIGWYGPTQRMTDEEWDRLLTINLQCRFASRGGC